MLHRCSNCPGHRQIQTVVKELSQVNDFDMEDSILYKQWVHYGHAKILYTTSSVGKFTEKFAQWQI
jgi:hypothetical protein